MATKTLLTGADYPGLDEPVRGPDVAFFLTRRLKGINLERALLPLAPGLVVEIISKNDRADDLNLEVSQYIAAETRAVWLFYPTTRLAYRYLPGRLEPEATSADHTLEEPELLPGFSLTVKDAFE